MEKWIKEARREIKSDVEYSFKICEATAARLHLEPSWAIEVFIAEFKKITKREDGGNSDG